MSRASSKPRQLQRLTAFLARWAPPGGWLVAALALVTLSAAAGVVLPMSPAGLVLQSAVGTAGAPLVPAWSGWLTWLLKTMHNFVGPLFAVSLVIVFLTFLRSEWPTREGWMPSRSIGASARLIHSVV